ncbi:YfhE family protein [Bacillus alkalicellulosilyticus]|nr:YfhE family protein [Bacillus alkalicellulosilyticus]
MEKKRRDKDEKRFLRKAQEVRYQSDFKAADRAAERHNG